MGTGMATDEVTDIIASIEMHRQEIERETGLAASCNFALRKLQELLHREQEALQLHGPGTPYPANVEAVTIEIKRIRALADTTRRRPMLKKPQPRQAKTSWRNEVRTPPKSRGRRTMGRRSG